MRQLLEAAPVYLRDQEGQTVNQSRNLRGLVTWFGKHYCKLVDITKDYNTGGSWVKFYFCGGYYAVTHFADHSVAKDWVINRQNLTHLKPTEYMNGDIILFDEEVKL